MPTSLWHFSLPKSPTTLVSNSEVTYFNCTHDDCMNAIICKMYSLCRHHRHRYICLFALTRPTSSHFLSLSLSHTLFNSLHLKHVQHTTWYGQQFACALYSKNGRVQWPIWKLYQSIFTHTIQRRRLYFIITQMRLVVCTSNSKRNDAQARWTMDTYTKTRECVCIVMCASLVLTIALPF